jgi:two-component system, chemotaxis family, CheB/CheR fusion protein
VLHSQGGAIDVQLIGTAAEEHAPGAVLVAIQDISARKRAEAALHEESRRKDDFLAALSHELRNPLSAIVSSLYVLQRAGPAEGAGHRAAAIIDRQVGQLVHIVDDLLDVTRIARGKVRLECEVSELGEIVRRAMDDHRPSFEAAAIAFEGHVDSERLWVDADAPRIVQVIGNLFGNALKFTPRGGRVDVSMRREGGSAVVSVRDTGMGIVKEVREHLFEPFMQGPQSLDRGRGGLGLGLTMVKGLVELHGGVVEVASDGLGRGAEFTFLLPLVAPPVVAAASAARSHVPRHRVLIIEDNPDAAEGLRNLLTMRGHDVAIAFDGPAGLCSAKEVLPDVVLCDIGLPGMDGYAVARAIRADPALARTYLVALSGYAQPEDSQRSAEAGFDCHIAKPPKLQQLEQVIGGAPLLSPSDRP